MVTMDYESTERTSREAREHFADVINDAIQGRITYITSHGRRVAAVVPLTELARKPRETAQQVTP